jgi:shikimate dehydrogenase
MNGTAHVPLAGVIGAPVAHSRSPRLHGHWLARYNLAGAYVPLHVEPANLLQVLQALPKAGFIGVNVTLPHKEAALAIADQVSATARRVGAANTLTFLPDGRLHADNTDATGFINNLRDGAPKWQPDSAPAVVLGAGGASRAVIVALLDAGAPLIHLTNRSQDRAEALARAFGPLVQVVPWENRDACLRGSGLVVNTTSLGMTGQLPLDLPLDGLSDHAVVTDIVYSPLETPLLRAAQKRGLHTVDGLGMLLHQGVPGFERWFGQRPVVDQATRAAVLGS